MNRTFVHDDNTSGKTLDDNQCEHVIDKFWLLGVGNVQCMPNTSFQDRDFDTSSLDEAFPDDESRVRCLMERDGSVGTTKTNWLLRSASSLDKKLVAGVSTSGKTTSQSVYGVVPACTVCP